MTTSDHRTRGAETWSRGEEQVALGDRLTVRTVRAHFLIRPGLEARIHNGIPLVVDYAPGMLVSVPPPVVRAACTRCPAAALATAVRSPSLRPGAYVRCRAWFRHPRILFSTTTLGVPRLGVDVYFRQPRSYLSGSSMGVPLRSSGVIFDPYTYTPPDKIPGIMSGPGLRHRMDSARGVWKSATSKAFLMKHLRGGFDDKAFASSANGRFERFMRAYQTGELKALRLLVTEGLFEGFQRELKAQRSGQHRSAFEVTGFKKDAVVVQMRYATHKGQRYGQVTCIVQSQRTVVQVDQSGQTVHTGADLAVPSMCVYEVLVSDPRATWRLARVEEFGVTDPRQAQEASSK